MLFGYELKKICKRISPLLALIILLATAIITMTLTAIFCKVPTTVTPDLTEKYSSLAIKINNWHNADHQAMANAFNRFYRAYSELNNSTWNGTTESGKTMETCYADTRKEFDNFYGYYLQYANDVYDYLLVQEKYAQRFADIIDLLKNYLHAHYTTREEINKNLNINIIIDQKLPETTLQEVLDNLFYVQIINQEDLESLQSFFQQYPANTTGYNLQAAYDYASNQYYLAVDRGTAELAGNISQYNGFTDYVDTATATRASKLALARLEHPENDFAHPFVFGNIYNNLQQVSLFDFIFTNMEMAMFLIVILVMIWAGCAFFTDTYRNTIITAIAATRKRSHVIIVKMLAVMTLALLSLLLMTGIYFVTGLIVFNACISPDILFLFNGTTVTIMSAGNYFVIYVLNLLWKLLPIIAICGMFSFVKAKPTIIISLTFVVYAAVVVVNALCGSIDLYQFIPLLALDPIRYCGAQLFLAPMPPQYNIWYTLPVMAVIDIALYWYLIAKFRHHDF